MHSALVLLLLLGLISSSMLVSCPEVGGTGSGSSEDSLVATKLDDTPSSIASRLNSGERLPDGFYTPPERGDQFASYYHIKSTDLPNPPESNRRHDVCTTNENEAFEWSRKALNSNMDNAQLYASEGNPLFFEYGWQDPDNPSTIRWNRIFNCNFIDRSEYDWENPGTLLATVEFRPLRKEVVKLLAEYLWYFSPKNNYGYTVLDTATVELEGALVYRITELTHPVEAVPVISECKTYLLMDSFYTLDTDSGELYLSETLRNSYQIKKGQYGFEVCK